MAQNTEGTKLERLNTLLTKPELGLPKFRQSVQPSGNNLQWLRKVLASHPECGDELRTLLGLSMKELLQPHVDHHPV